jgi:hypothetical protein
MIGRRLLLSGFTALGVCPALAANTDTVKTVTVVARPASTNHNQFVAKLEAEYGPLAAVLPSQKGLIISSVVMAQPRSDVVQLGISPYDAVIESFFASPADQTGAVTSATGVATDAALARLVGTAHRFVTRETVVVPLPAGVRPKVVGLTFVMKPPAVSDAEFRNEWIVVHGPMAQQVPHLQGFTVSERISDGAVPGVPSLPMDGPLQGFTESWVADVASRAAMVATPEARKWYAHGAEIFGKVRTDLLVESVFQPVTS